MNYKELMAADIPIASAIISYGEDWKIERVNTEFVNKNSKRGRRVQTA